MSLRSCFIIILLASCAGSSHAGWKKIAVIPATEGEVHCGFFFDEMNGFIGTGSWTSGVNFFIRRTTDGGKTWTVCTTPKGEGLITSIFMKDPLIGYASVAIYPAPVYTLLKTTDGGITWNDDSYGHEVISTSVYATSAALVRTEWENNESGAFSINDGGTFSGIDVETNIYGTGIDFTDALNGVLVDYGLNDFYPTWSTTDGGITWQKGIDSLPESWSVYAVKGTQTYVTLPEGKVSDRSNIVYWSQNGGINWQERAIVPAAGFTGHIGGVGNTIYVQTDYITKRGLFRSDDLGLTWKNVGGPSNDFDTRFVVAGCKGQVVYAFDNQGGVYKTTDGGDGTLIASSGDNPLLALTEDSLFMQAYFCQPARNYFHITNATCNSNVTIDSVTFTPNQYNEFSVDTVISGTNLGATVNGFGIPILFRSDSDARRETLVRIQAHSGALVLDTTIILTARQSLAPDPYLGVPNPAKVGSTTALIPVFLHPTQDSFRIMHYAFHISYDGDVLTPATNPYSVVGTLSAGATVQLTSLTPGGATFTVDFTAPLTEASDLTLPLFYVQMDVFLSRHLYSDIRLDSFSFAGGNQPLALLQMCSVPETMFLVDRVCGDSSISGFMLTGKVPGFISVHPNPNTGTFIEAEIYLPQENDLNLEVIDASGKSSQKIFDSRHFTSGNHTIPVNTSSLPSGTYILRMSAGDGSVANQEIIIMR